MRGRECHQSPFPQRAAIHQFLWIALATDCAGEDPFDACSGCCAAAREWDSQSWAGSWRWLPFHRLGEGNYPGWGFSCLGISSVLSGGRDGPFFGLRSGMFHLVHSIPVWIHLAPRLWKSTLESMPPCAGI